MVWTKETILAGIRKLYQSDANLSYNAMQKTHQSLLSASAYHFKSYRNAIEKAGIDYADIRRRPRWSKASIIKLLKSAKRSGLELNWAAVTKRRDELGKAAFASLQRRLFGSWDRALHAAGLDADEINCYNKWTRSTVAFEIKSIYKENEDVSSGAMQKNNPGLHAAAVRYFVHYDSALKAAGINPVDVRHRRKWTEAEVLKEIKAAKRAGKNLSDTHIRQENSPLYGASLRLFGSFVAARKAAGVELRRPKKR